MNTILDQGCSKFDKLLSIVGNHSPGDDVWFAIATKNDKLLTYDGGWPNREKAEQAIDDIKTVRTLSDNLCIPDSYSILMVVA